MVDPCEEFELVDVDAELFHQLASKCRFAGLTVADLAPRELPETGERGISESFGKQYLSRRVLKNPGDYPDSCRRGALYYPSFP